MLRIRLDCRKLDWVDTIWPEDMKVPGEYPRVQKYCLMSVERCWTVRSND
jgi:F-box/leucine-rich repeat protein 10/11